MVKSHSSVYVGVVLITATISSLLPFRILDATLPDSKRFRRELSDSQKSVLRSTLIPPDNAVLKGSGIRELAQEIINIINEEQKV